MAPATEKPGDGTHSRIYVLAIACAASIGYIQTYFFRYPMFVLPLTGSHAGLPLKTWLSLASVAGYGVSKIPAYFVVSALDRKRRLRVLLTIMFTMAATGVGLFGVLPWWGQALGVFLSGVAGSWAYGIVFQYVEGRQHTEIINASIMLTIVFGGALARASGTGLLETGIPSGWMPAAVAGLALIPGCGCLVALDSLPNPSSADKKARAVRQPMAGPERTAFVLSFLPGLIVLVILYSLIVAYRSWRDFFASDIYTALLHRSPSAGVFLLADWPGGVISTLMVGSVFRIRDNRLALLCLHGIVFFGGAVLLVSVLLLNLMSESQFPPLVFIVLVGIGLYAAVASLGSVMFERMLAASHTTGTAAFLIFVSDGFGYLGSVALLIRNGMTSNHESPTELRNLFITLTGVIGVVTCTLSLTSGIYFSRRLSRVHDTSIVSERSPLINSINSGDNSTV